jgi:co-chaperonin GroES (HSP10)
MKEIPMKIRPLQDRIIMKRIPEEEKSRGGIIIPDTAKEKPLEGLVVAVGNGKVLEDGKVRWTSSRATGCCSSSTPVTRSKLTARNT